MEPPTERLKPRGLPMAEERIMRLKEVMYKTGLNKTAINRMHLHYKATGEILFPISRQLTERTVGYLWSEIRQWMIDRPFSITPKTNHPIA